MKKYLLTLILCFGASVVFAASVTVNSHSALDAEISGSADTIFIDGNIAVSATLQINRNIVFIGINNGTLDGNHTNQIINISAMISVKINNLTFINGKSVFTNGGAIFMMSTDTLIIKNCKFINNIAIRGGAIDGTNIKHIFLENCEFINNTATQVGGGIWVGGTRNAQYVRIGTLYVINCLFDGNSAVQATGGLDTHSWNRVTIFNSAFINNYSGSTDPAAICVGGNAQTNIINSTIAKNHSDGGAGGIGLWESENLNIYNCVLAGNSAANGASDIANTPVNYNNSTVKMYNSVYQQIISPVTLSVNVNNFGNVQPNAIFVDYANGDFHLLDGTVGINSGDETDYITQWNLTFPTNTIISPTQHRDVIGSNRVTCTLDMGAYESYYPVIIPFSDTFCENKTYNFKGRILTDEGIFYDTIPSTLIDCDTIFKLNLTKLNKTYYSYRDTSYKCEWYYFGNDSINKTGIYVDTLTAVNGCDSIVTLDLLVRPKEFNDTLNICAENLPITVYDTVFSANAVSGTYIVHHRCAIITFLLDIKPKTETFPPDIPKICADDDNFVLKFLPTNSLHTKSPTNYEIIFDNQAITAGFYNQQGDVVNNEIVVEMPEKIYPDYYNCQIILSDNIYDCSPQLIDIQFPVFYPDSIMMQKWDNVIALLNEFYNGGFLFSAYQWYRNGIIMQGETYSYIYLNEYTLKIGDKYSVLITRPDGSQMLSCDFIAHEPRPQLYDYPQIVQNGNSVTIYIKGKARANLWTMTGVLLQSTQLFDTTHEITVPAKGAYLLEILSNNNLRNVEKIIVK